MSSKTGNRLGVVLKLTVVVSPPPPPPHSASNWTVCEVYYEEGTSGNEGIKSKGWSDKKKLIANTRPLWSLFLLICSSLKGHFFLCFSWPVVNSRKWLVFPSLTFSLSVSKAEVASSRSRICGLRTRALAMAILCFCPPEIKVPLSPTRVS